MPQVILRDEVVRVLDDYDPAAVSLAAVGSHSCLDVCDGAADEGITSIALCQRGREAPYARYFRSMRDSSGRRVRGCVDEAWVYDRFDDVLSEREQARLRKRNALFVPNRSFTSYCDVATIESAFRVPIVGSRNLLRTEERGEGEDYYALLAKAGMPFPPRIKDPDSIDRLAIVKLHHAKKRLERGFFTAASPEEFREKSGELLSQGVITRDDLEAARIEDYIIGPVFNFNFFWSPLNEPGDRLELLGVDWRFESSLDGHVRLPAPQQMRLVGTPQEIPEMTVVGHNTATIRESLLDKVFDLGEKFAAACATHHAPGIIGPFCLQTCVDKDMRFFVYDVAPRIGGGTNVHVAAGHPYGNALYRSPMSSGRRLALEVRRAIESDRLPEIVT